MMMMHHLGMSEDGASKVVFVKCHKIGRRSPHGKRPIIVRFQYYPDRQCIWNKRFQLKRTIFSLHENFANEVEYPRKLMYPIMAAAKKSDKYDKVYLNGDVLKINGIDYSADNLNNLPKDLRPHNFAIKENKHWCLVGFTAALTFCPISTHPP